MINLHHEFDTEAEAIAWRDGMYESYPPMGYSTHIRIERATVGRGEDAVTKWVAWGSRAESCD